MACAQQSAAEYLRNFRCKLVTHMQNFPLIIENLYQRKVFNDHDIDALKAERTEFDKARYILDWVVKKGEMASYELLKILDLTRKRTLHSDLHYWISCFSFMEDADAVYSFGTCQNYQTQLKMKAKCILENQWQQSRKYLQNKTTANFSYVPLVLQTDSVVKTADYKIQMKRKKCKKPRAKKLKLYIPDSPETLSPEDLLKGNKNILLIGKPGIGKTTAVQQILKVWTEKDNKDHDYMFYFDESVMSCNFNGLNLQSFLFDIYLKPKENERKEVFQDIEENSENVVFIFDGVSCVQDHSILRKIIDRDVLPEAKVIITCRSEVEDDPLFLDWRTMKVYVQGFSEESIRTYYQKMLSHKPDLLDVVLNNQELFSLSYVPMYALMIAAFISFNSNTAVIHPHTVTEMYIHIFRDALKKHGRKRFGQIDQYLSKNKDQLYHLMENAFCATEQKSLNLPEISCDETNICHAFLKTIPIRDSLTSAVTYCAFLHNTMQEFFSALWLLGNPDEIEKVLKLCQTEENKHMRHLLPFLCGLLGEHNSKLLKCLFLEDQMKKTLEWFIEKLMDTFLQSHSDGEDIDLLFVCQCLYELQSPKACLMFLEKMNYQWDIDVNLDPHQSCALSYVFSQSRDKEVYLNMKDCTVFDTGVNMILSSSPQIRLSKEILQVLAECVYEAQEEELTLCFLQKVGRDLTSCSLNWEKLHYFLQHEVQHVTVDLKKIDMSLNIKEIMPFLNKIHCQQMSSTFMLSLIREIYESRSSGFVFNLLRLAKNCINLQNRTLDSVDCAAVRFILQNCTAVTLNMLWTSIPDEEIKSILSLFSHVSRLSVDRLLLLRMFHCCSTSDVHQETSALLLSALQHKLDFSCNSALDLTEDTLTETLQLTAEDCHVVSAVIQRACSDTHLNLHDCQINTAGVDELFTVLHSVKLSCDKSMLLQFLSHVGRKKAEALSQSLDEEVDLSQTQLDMRVFRGLGLVLEHSQGLTVLDLSQCHLTDQSLNLFLTVLHKAQNIDFSGNSITDDGAQKIYSIVSHNSNIKIVRLFNNQIKNRELFHRDPRFQIW